MEQTINANVAQCLKTASYWGETKIYNVCNGAVNSIPWGSLDYMGGLGIWALALVLISIGIALAVMLWRCATDLF